MYSKYLSCIFIYHDREIFHGRRWHEDPRFASPMITTSSGIFYIFDFVQFHLNGTLTLGRISHFVTKVSVVVVTSYT